ncbi:hypothetical protein H4R24_002588 [Coemansia sp. RSA 988]|nr:hypothetical protein H4R24_002588 [Coemansia sp. RSA 988]
MDTVAAQCTFVVFAYSTLVKDKQILFGEVHNEYNQKFVYPNVFAPKEDAATSTLDDWMLDRGASRIPASSNSDIDHMQFGQTMRDNASWRRATPFAAEDVDSGEQLPREKYRRVPHFRGQTKDSPPVPAPYVRTNNLGRSAVPQHASAQVNKPYGFQDSHMVDSGYRQPYAEPSGTHRVRDRSSRRRRHTELMDSARHAK